MLTDNARKSVDVLKAEDLHQISTSKNQFSKIHCILKEFEILEEGSLNPKSFESLVDALALGFMSDLKKLKDKKEGTNFLRDSNTQRILSSLAFLAKST